MDANKCKNGEKTPKLLFKLLQKRVKNLLIHSTMKYYKIHTAGPFGLQKWVRCKFDPTKRQVKLYNDDFTIKGIGLY